MSRFSGWILAASVVFALPNCAKDKLNKQKKDDDNSTKHSSKPMSADDICAIYEARMQNAARVGVDETYDSDWVMCFQSQTTTGPELTEDYLAHACRAGTPGYIWAHDLLSAIDNNVVAVDWKKAHECLDVSRDKRAHGPSFGVVGTSSWEDVKNGACKTFFQGKIEANGNCRDEWDCADGLGCYTDAAWTAGTAKCMPLGVQNSACDDIYHPCSTGFACNDGHCQELLSGGASCDDDTQCLSGLCTGFPTTCAPVSTANAPLALGETCVSCERLGDPTACGAVNGCAWNDENAFCAPQQNCGGGCTTCRANEAAGPTTCSVFSGEGEYCEDYLDCVFDLDCIEHVCGTVAVDQPCAINRADGPCAEGMTCMSDNACQNIDVQGDCEADANCGWVYDVYNYYGTDYDYSYCTQRFGICTVLPTSGPCDNGLCGEGTYCASNDTCVAYALETQECDDTGVSAPYCAGQFWCVEGTCQYACEVREDCGPGMYCFADDYTDDMPQCLAESGETCIDSAACPEGMFCGNDGENCHTFAVETDCNADTRCLWTDYSDCQQTIDCTDIDTGDECNAATGCSFALTSESCERAATCAGCIDCATHDGDETTCNTFAECAYDSGSSTCVTSCSTHADVGACGGDENCTWTQFGDCTSTLDCSAFDNDTDCGNTAGCEWSPFGLCSSATDSDTCLPKRGAGELCDYYSYGVDCQSDACTSDADGNYLCEVDSQNQGCNGQNDHRKDFLSFTFLFGSVWIMARWRRSKKN